MSELPPCPDCSSPYAYEDRGQLVCPECGHEWTPGDAAAAEPDHLVVTDANGNPLADGDTVTVIKDLKVKGSSQGLKIGSKTVIRRIVEGKDHELDCKFASFGEVMVTAKFVKKA